MEKSPPYPQANPLAPVVNSPTDEFLMLAHRAGDRAAFANLYKRYSPTLLRLFSARGIPSSHRKDLLQQTFLHLHRARHDFREDAKLRPWLFTIADNLRRQYFRRKQRKPEQPLELEIVEQYPDIAIDAQLNSQLDVTKALECLPPGHYDVIVLRWYVGLTFPEISTILEIGLSTAKKRASQSYQMLRGRLMKSDSGN